MVMASSWSWVTWMKVRPTSVWIRLISICIDRRSLRSRAPSGSSRSSTSGLLISARASATRCCCPPDSWAGFFRAWLLELDQLEHLAHLLVDVARLAAPQPEGDVLVDVEVREQCVALEDGVDRTLVGLGVGDVVAGQRDRAGAGRLQSGHHPQRGGLAAAGGAQECEERAPRYVEVQLADGVERAVVPGQLAQRQPVVRRRVGRLLRGPAPQPPVTSANSPSYLVASASVSGLMSIVLARISSVGKISSFSTSEGSIFSISSWAPWTGQM